MIAPFEVTEACIATLQAHQGERFADFERAHGLLPGTLTPLGTDHLAGEGFRLRKDKPPIALVGTFGTAETPARNKNAALDFNWTLAVEVTVVGVDRGDTIRKRDWYGMLTAEILLVHLPRAANPIDALELMDLDLTPAVDPDSQQTVGQARLIFDVTVRNGLSLVLPFRTATPAGARAATPTSVTATIIKESPS